MCVYSKYLLFSPKWVCLGSLPLVCCAPSLCACISLHLSVNIRCSCLTCKEVQDFDAAEYHDAAEEPIRKDESDNTVEPQRLSEFQGGYGSSSLKECVELLNTTSKIAPAPLDSGIGQNSTEPPQVMSPSMEGKLTDAHQQLSNGSNSQEVPPVIPPVDGSNSQEKSQVKDEPLSQVKCESPEEAKAESSSPAREVKTEHDESEN